MNPTSPVPIYSEHLKLSVHDKRKPKAVESEASSRWFGELPFSHKWSEVRQHALGLGGAWITSFVADGGREGFLFNYLGHEFTVRSHGKQLLFAVEGVEWSERVLGDVLSHFAVLLAPGRTD